MKPQRLIPIGLTAVLGFQVFAMVFFFTDAAEEMAHDPTGLHPISEAIVALALGCGLVFVARALIASLRAAKRQSTALAIASGEFRRAIEAQFDLWNLTKAERAVATHSLQGHALERIAEIRGSAVGTVRAQLARIYAKSGVSNRAQLSAVFVERLMSIDPPA